MIFSMCLVDFEFVNLRLLTYVHSYKRQRPYVVVMTFRLPIFNEGLRHLEVAALARHHERRFVILVASINTVTSSQSVLDRVEIAELCGVVHINKLFVGGVEIPHRVILQWMQGRFVTIEAICKTKEQA